MNSKLLTLLVLFIPLSVFAQQPVDGYYTGYIVNIENDTIRGKILDEDDYLSVDKITLNTSGTDKDYTPIDIRAFYINELDLLFESHTITKNQDSNTLYPMEGEPSGVLVTDKHFLLALAKTQEEAVYSYQEASGQLRLYFRNSKKIEELLVFRNYSYEGGVRIPQEKNRFRIQLLGFLIGCDNLQKSINGALYSENSLKALFISYAKCMGTELTYVPKTSRTVFTLGASVGFGTVISTNQSRTVIFGNGIENARMRQSGHEGGSWFEAGLALRGRSTRNSKLAYKAELKFRQQDLKTVWDRPIPVSNVVSRVIYTFTNTNVMLNFLADLNVSRWDTGLLFAEAGISVIKSISQKAEMSSGVFDGTGYTFTDMNSDEFMVLDSDLSFILGFGAKLNHMVFSLRYSQNFGGNLNEENGIAIAHSSLSLNATYNFK